MATDGWRTSRSLTQQIEENCGNFNYFQLIHLLDLQAEKTGTKYRFSSDLSEAFPASEITYIKRGSGVGRDGKRSDSLTAKTSNYCIAGYSGPLPEAFSGWIVDLQKSGNSSAVDFLDLFNNRINLLRYEAKSSSRQALDSNPPESNLLSNAISAVMGLYSNGLYRSMKLSKRSLMALAGLVANHRVGCHSIERILRACFNIPLVVRDLVGGWNTIAEDNLCKLGVTANRLGELCLLGTQVWDMRKRIRASIGPLHFDQFIKYLPAFEFSHSDIQEPEPGSTFYIAKHAAAFRDISRFLTNRSADVLVTLEVESESVTDYPFLRYPSSPDSAFFRLGQTTWLGKPTIKDCRVSYLISDFDDSETDYPANTAEIVT